MNKMSGVDPKLVKKAYELSKKIKEKKTGESYKSASEKKKHEAKESKKEMIKEYGKKVAMRKSKM